MIAMTCAGMSQSGYAFSLTVDGLLGRTRLMKFSLTSTSTSSESMSTIVPMPVRVKPPPAEIGDTISPSCAALTVTMPANGARTTVSSRLRSREREARVGDGDGPRRDVQARPRRVVVGFRGVERLRADDRAHELLLVALRTSASRCRTRRAPPSRFASLLRAAARAPARLSRARSCRRAAR